MSSLTKFYLVSICLFFLFGKEVFAYEKSNTKYEISAFKKSESYTKSDSKKSNKNSKTQTKNKESEKTKQQKKEKKKSIKEVSHKQENIKTVKKQAVSEVKEKKKEDVSIIKEEVDTKNEECFPSNESPKVSKKLQEAQFYFLFDPQTSQVLLSKNADLRIAPSSMTKIMTAYVVFDQIKKGRVSLDKQCFVSKNAWRKSGSSMFLNYGDMVSIDDLLKGLLAVSGNDASIALAEAVAGSLGNFIDLMNIKARELNLINSHFANPHGLNEPRHYMSIRDLAYLTARFYQDFPQYAGYLGIESFTYGKITQINRNPLIKKHYDGILGGKTGHTDDGGYGVVGAVKRDNRMLIAVVNKARTPRLRSDTITELFDYGFANYKKYSFFNSGSEIANLKTWLGNSPEVKAVVKDEVTFSLPITASPQNLSMKVEYKGPIYAPIKQGDKVATLIIKMNNQKVMEYPLYAKESMDKVGYFGKLNQILRYKMRIFFNKVF
ncbi:MAG: D-alanyl-D-alanine carboxypeptidase [Pelagibacterales bacterium]|nr:D-alanyl-D-alanine carboxypeptidase [Pelagibacterales bacterium]